jgi:protein phosphatase
MKRFFAGMTDPGVVRSTNQDAYYIDPEGRFFVVADGMGGHAGGQEASRLAIEIICSFLATHWESDDTTTPHMLEQAFYKANQAIIDEQRSNPELADMGTTAVVVLFREQAWCANVGDSRIYRSRDTCLEQLTEDQTWVAKSVKLGILTPEQARLHPMRHVLVQCLGRQELSEIEIRCVDVQSGDLILLCSDGLTEELSDARLAAYLQTVSTCEATVSALVQAAKTHGGRDNITAVLIALDPLDDLATVVDDTMI